MTSTTGISTEMWMITTTVAGLAIGTIVYFLKRTMSKVDSHDGDITNIKLTYVTKTELGELKEDLSSSVEKLEDAISTSVGKLEKDVSGIKDKYLTKEDFYRTQAKTEQKLDKMYDLLLKISQRGGPHDER